MGKNQFSRAFLAIAHHWRESWLVWLETYAWIKRLGIKTITLFA